MCCSGSSLWLQTALGLSPRRAGLQGSAPLSLAATPVLVSHAMAAAERDADLVG
ncbi:MAG: hypothetical protein ABJB47_13115 [Actinomycetota bacterium]